MNAATNRTLIVSFQKANTKINNLFTKYLTQVPHEPLHAAMSHLLFNGGKRLRSALIFAIGELFDTPMENMLLPAAAIEAIHTYSLIHDDLPCMDNANLRRNKPTCHLVFGENMAVLAGDALQTMAFEILSTYPAALSNQQRLQMIKTLSRASGAHGMVAGQALDMSNLRHNLPQLSQMYQLKTGALFAASVELARISADNEDEQIKVHFNKLGQALGLAFQIQDDILDVEKCTATLGKTQGMDTQNNKITYLTHLGVEQAKQTVLNLYQEINQILSYFDHRVVTLQNLISAMLHRNN